METLIGLMGKVLADAYAFQLKANLYHWNVEGPNFPQYHDFLGKLYEEVFGATDEIAEQIRTLDAYAPGSFTRFLELTDITFIIGFPICGSSSGKMVFSKATTSILRSSLKAMISSNSWFPK